MRKIAFMAACAAFLLTTPALAETITARIVAVDQDSHTVTLDDGTVMNVAPEVDLSAVHAGEDVAITAEASEDGFAPATEIKPAQ